MGRRRLGRKVGAVALTFGALGLVAEPAQSAPVTIPAPSELGLRLVWNETNVSCGVVSPCISRGWTLRVGLSSDQYVGLAARLRRARLARQVVEDRTRNLQRWPGTFVERTRRGVELHLATAQPYGNALMEVMARRGKRIVVLQILGSPALPPEASLRTLQRHAIAMAKRGQLPLGEVVPN